MRTQRFDLVIDERRRTLRTPYLLIGNNRSTCQVAGHEERDLLADAELSVCAVAVSRHLRFAAFALRALCGMNRPERDFTELDAAGCVEIEGEGVLSAVLDGEPVMLDLPLRMSVAPSALGVVGPRMAAKARFAVVRSF